MLIRNLIISMLLVCTMSGETLATEPDSLSGKTRSQKDAFKELIRGTIITTSYFGTYSFMLGTSLAGSELGVNNNPGKATAKWAGASLLGMVLSLYTAESLVKPYKKMHESGAQNIEQENWRFYRAFFGGASLANIHNFKGESIFEGADGGPQWVASTPQVDVTMTFPVFGYRVGAHGERFGGEFESSIVSHHTTKQTATYDASGEIYVSKAGRFMPIVLNDVAIPDKFLMLHSLSLGGNFYTWLPDIGVKPYVGIGARFLLNSVQSQYPGPAELVQQKGGLALDSITMGYGINVFLGLHIPLSGNKFLYTEFRPAGHFFRYDSGNNQLQEHDKFTLQSFDFQMGLGVYY